MPTLEINTHANGGANNMPQAPAPPALGTLIDDGNAGALQLTTVLGYGGYGVVYRAVGSSGGLYAVKCLLRSSSSSNPKQAQRQRRLHLREIALHRLAGAGAHPGIVRLHQVIEPTLPAADGNLTIPSPYMFLVMDFAPCGDLFTLILHRQVYLGRTGLVGRVFAQLAAAVSHCHSLGIFHRDLKPENVLCWDGGATVRLGDFGLATTERRSKEWRTGSVYHMSPECQNGNASSPPYSPLANDIWSLAILLLNLLTARNPWARASPSDPTFSAYLSSPRNFLPQVLPISSGLNDVLVRALDVSWERRESFGVDGLAEGVARLVVDDENENRRGLSFKPRMGMYAPDVVFEGGMARCPWEVGMHIPSGSSDSGDRTSNQIRIPPELMVPPSPKDQQQARGRRRSSSASFIPSSIPHSPSPSMVVESQDIQPPTPMKEHSTIHVESLGQGTTQMASRWSTNSSSFGEKEDTSGETFTKPSTEIRDNSAMSEIRFANRSDAEDTASSSTGSSVSSSDVSSIGSSYSATRTPGLIQEFVEISEPRVSDVDLTTDEVEGYVYAYAASAESPLDPELPKSKAAYPDIYTQTDRAPSRRGRFRGRSRGRQPYPQLTQFGLRDSATRKPRARKAKPELKLNVDLPTFSPLNMHSSGANGSRTVRSFSRSRSPGASFREFRRRAREESLSSCPFAYSRSASLLSDPEMDIDRNRERSRVDIIGRYTDPDVHMISPSTATEDGVEKHGAALDRHESESFHDDFNNFSISPSPVTLASPAGATEDAREIVIPVSASSPTQTSPTSPGSVSVDSNGRDIYRVERSTLDTASPTNLRFQPSESGSQNSNDFLNYVRSTSPSASSSRYRANVHLGPNNLLDADMLGLEPGEEVVSRRNSGTSRNGTLWANEPHRPAGNSRRNLADIDLDTSMDMDATEELPTFPGSYPTLPAESKSQRTQPDVHTSRPMNNTGEVRGLDLDLYANSRLSSTTWVEPEMSDYEDVNDQVASSQCSVPPPSVRTRSDSADEALRTLHALAIESNPWTAPLDTSGWHRSQSQSSVSTRASQAFMAITTDVNARPSSDDAIIPSSAVTANDFEEYAPYLRYADSAWERGSEVLTPPSGPASPLPRTSSHSFRRQQPTGRGKESAINRHSFREQLTSSIVQSGETSDRQTPVRQRPIFSRHRSGSLLKFVARRPFSSSGAGFIPSYPSQASSAIAMDPEAGFQFGESSTTDFSSSLAAANNGYVSAAVNINHGQKQRAVEPDSPFSRPSSTPPNHSSFKRQRIESPVSAQPVKFFRPNKPSKSHTWSFTRSRSQSRRRSRSLSPPPARGSPRDVLFRLRSARNWFWYALSGMTARSTSSSGARSRKSSGTNLLSHKPHVVGIAV